MSDQQISGFVNFTNANLQHASFKYTEVYDADFTGADITGVYWGYTKGLTKEMLNSAKE